MLRRSIVLTLLAASSVAWADTALPYDDDFEALCGKFQATLDDLRDEHGFPGATAAFMLRDGRIGVAATGVSDRERGTPMQPNARMFSGSIGKMFVAATVLRLVDEGKLALDAPISTWLSEERWFDKLANSNQITLKQLLNHSSGIRNHVDEAGFAVAAGQRMAAGRLDEPFTPEELVKFILRKEPHFAPGEGFQYTDTGYILLGMIIEKATGNSYYDLLQKRFLGPLRLTLTSPADSRRIPGLVPGYLKAGNPFGVPECSMVEPGLLAIHPGSEWTGGGLVTNPRDLVRWAMALFHDHVLGDAMTMEMLTNTVEIRRGNDVFHYGLGIFIFDTPLGTTYGHGGWYPGYNSQLEYFPSRKFAVAIQINRDYDNPRQDYIQALAEPVIRALAMAESP